MQLRKAISVLRRGQVFSSWPRLFGGPVSNNRTDRGSGEGCHGAAWNWPESEDYSHEFDGSRTRYGQRCQRALRFFLSSGNISCGGGKSRDSARRRRRAWWCKSPRQPASICLLPLPRKKLWSKLRRKRRNWIRRARLRAQSSTSNKYVNCRYPQELPATIDANSRNIGAGAESVGVGKGVRRQSMLMACARPRTQ